ncbi:cytochrome P450 90D2-like [Zingiber officinale]|nr:cytochrome P450 90D2-like [Zingiber officinale]
MEELTNCLIIISFFTFIILLLHQRRRGSSSSSSRGKISGKLPAGTDGWPFVGETLDFISCAYSPRPETFIDKRRSRHGKVFRSHLFGSPMIVSADADVTKCVLQSDSRSFVPSYPRSLTELMGKSSILVINGSLQRRVHGLIGAFLKSPAVKVRLAGDMQRYVRQSMAGWEDGQVVRIQDEAKNIIFRILVKGLIGLEAGKEMELLKQEFKEFIAGLMSLPMKIPGSQLYKSLRAKKKMVRVIKSIIDEKRRRNLQTSAGASTPTDVVEVLINDSGDSDRWITDDLISDNVVDLMIPAEDSVPVLVTLAVKFLGDSPIALQQLQEENMFLKEQKKLAGEDLQWNDYMSLSFTQHVITETLRVGNIISGIMRKAVRDVEIKGHLIPKGWCVFTYFRSVHLDEAHFDEPYKFNPWRWKDKEYMSSCNFTPFGGGQRLCPGMDLARLEASIFLHHLVTNFTWVAEEDQIVNFPTVRMKKKMPIRVRRRSDIK